MPKDDNTQLISLYWDIGALLVQRKSIEGWGKAVVQRLAHDLQVEFPGLKGFSVSNLWRMKKFFETYCQNEKLAPLVREIGWSHNLAIMEQCSSSAQREFYLRMTRKLKWSKSLLMNHISNKSFEKSLMGQNNFDRTLTPRIYSKANLAIRDEYTFEFLDLGDVHSEAELEQALISRMEDFLRAMGGMFAFMGSQYRLVIDSRNYFVDLLLFHRHLRCLVAIELKIGEFKPEYVGKMQFYLTALDRLVRQDDESPSIGIILCKDKSRTIVEYALHQATKPIGVATYEITKKLPHNLVGHLPSPEEISQLMEGLEDTLG